MLLCLFVMVVMCAYDSYEGFVGDEMGEVGELLCWCVWEKGEKLGCIVAENLVAALL